MVNGKFIDKMHMIFNFINYLTNYCDMNIP